MIRPSNAAKRRRALSHCVLVLSLASVATVPATAAAADLTATPANLPAVVSSAAAGDTILLAAGDYGTFSGAMKPGEVILRPQPGAAVSMQLKFAPAANITIDAITLTEIEIGDSATKNITVRNSDIPGQATLRTGELQNANILFDHNVHRDFDKCDDCGEGRVWLPEKTGQASGITIQNSEFKGGLSDGILNGSRGTRIVANVFHDLEQGTPRGVHTDAIQLYGSSETLIKGNHFYDVPDAIMAPDGADHEIIEDNVFAGDDNGYPFAITLWSDDGSIVRHNTLADGSCAFDLRCGIISIGSKRGEPGGKGTIVMDNILGEISHGEGTAAIAELAHNLFRAKTSGSASLRGTPSYVGGSKPTTWQGYALQPGSIGTASASDGLDRGIRIGQSAPATSAAPAGRPPARSKIRVLSSLRSIGKSGRLRLRIRTAAAGVVVVATRIRPGRRVSSSRARHSRRLIKPKPRSLGRLPAGSRTVSIKLSRNARRMLGRSRSARLSVSLRVGPDETTARLRIRR